MSTNPRFEERHGLLRFQVAIGGQLVDAFISRATCQADAVRSGQGSLAAFYRQHRPAIDAVVLGKLRSGARNPVVVMASDLRQPASVPVGTVEIS